MEIAEVCVPTTDPAVAGAFYAQVLGLAGESGGDGAVVVRAGSTRLRLQHRPGRRGSDHLAFLVAANRFADAKRRLRERVPLLTLNGDDEFEGPAGWNSRSVYFGGPDGSVLELIARRDLPDSGSGDSGDVLSVSEVGIAVADVRGTVGRLGRAGLVPFAGPPGTDFAAVGDQRGLLILATEGRPWLPTRDRLAAAQGLTVLVRGGLNAEVEVGAARVRPEDGRPSA